MKWNGRDYRPPMGRRIYPPRQESITELLKPLAEKSRKGNVWVPVLNQPLNVQSPSTSPAPPVSASPTPTPTSTPGLSPSATPTNTPTPTPSTSQPEPSASPTQTPSGTPTSTPTPSSSSSILPSVEYLTQSSSNTTANSWTYNNISWGDAGLLVVGTSNGNTSSSVFPILDVKVNGVSMTMIVDEANSYSTGGRSASSAIYALEIASATTISITVTTTGNAYNNQIGVWKITGLSSTTPVNSVSRQGDGFGTDTVVVAGIPANSVAIQYINYSNGIDRALVISPTTERFESWVESMNNVAGGDGVLVGGDTNFSASFGGTTNGPWTNLAAIWR